MDIPYKDESILGRENGDGEAKMRERDREIERHTIALLPSKLERLTLIGRIVNGVILQNYVSEFFDAKGPPDRVTYIFSCIKGCASA